MPARCSPVRSLDSELRFGGTDGTQVVRLATTERVVIRSWPGERFSGVRQFEDGYDFDPVQMGLHVQPGRPARWRLPVFRRWKSRRFTGHSEVTTTLTIYSHLFPSDHADAMAALGAMNVPVADNVVQLRRS